MESTWGCGILFSMNRRRFANFGFMVKFPHMESQNIQNTASAYIIVFIAL